MMSGPSRPLQEAMGAEDDFHRHQIANDNQASPITPELLVDALSGHEDGLLAIAERLMLSYDRGHDAMGEAIIDAFADVQKLFQHVVEAAHMEGAAFESLRREQEWKEIKERVEREKGISLDDFGSFPLDSRLDSGQQAHGELEDSDMDGVDRGNLRTAQQSPHRHEELVDQDVRDVLLAAIKRSSSLQSAQKYEECRKLYEKACLSASALLPVDSDHRGRLQLATVRAESMSPDRSCAILRYAMDNVLRSGLSLSLGRYTEDEGKERGDCVLTRVDPWKRVNNSNMPRYADNSGAEVTRNHSSDDWNSFSNWDFNGGGMDLLASRLNDSTATTAVEQSSEEALASLVEEMKEILQAPVYATTPLLSVSDKFWMALGEARKTQARKEELLEQALAKNKADFLLAREEWEEELSRARETTESIKRRFNQLKLESDNNAVMQRERSGDLSHKKCDTTSNSINTPSRSHASSTVGGSPHQFQGLVDDTTLDSSYSQSNKNHKLGRSKINSSGSSVVSMGSEFAQRAKSLVHLINCQGREQDELVPSAEQRQKQKQNKNYVGGNSNNSPRSLGGQRQTLGGWD